MKSVLTLETNLFFFPVSEAQLAEMDGPPSVSLNCRSEMGELRVWRTFISALLCSALLEFICGISSVNTHFLCRVFQFLVAAGSSSPYFLHWSLDFFFLFIFSLSGFSELLSSVIYRIWFQASLFLFFPVLNFVSFELLTVGIPELILASFAHWFCHLLSLFWSRLRGILNAVCQTFNFLWPHPGFFKINQKPI